MLTWPKRLLLPLPFVIAAALTFLMWFSDHYRWRGQLATRYAFLFAMPWARLLGGTWIPNPRSHFLQALLGYALVLWIPAAFYFVCIWIVLRVIQGWVMLFQGRLGGGPPNTEQP